MYKSLKYSWLLFACRILSNSEAPDEEEPLRKTLTFIVCVCTQEVIFTFTSKSIGSNSADFFDSDQGRTNE